MSDLILPGGRPIKPAKPTIKLNAAIAARLRVSVVGDITIEDPTQILVPEQGDWMVVSLVIWQDTVNRALEAEAKVAELEMAPASRRARRVAAKKPTKRSN